MGSERVVGPGRTTRGSGSPRSAYSSRIDSGGNQVGRTALRTMLVFPRGVSHPTRPMLMGHVCTTGSPFG